MKKEDYNEIFKYGVLFKYNIKIQDHEFIKQFISNLLEANKTELLEAVENLKELHTHNSIPSYTADLNEGCFTCLKNSILDKVLDEIVGNILFLL